MLLVPSRAMAVAGVLGGGPTGSPALLAPMPAAAVPAPQKDRPNISDSPYAQPRTQPIYDP